MRKLISGVEEGVTKNLDRGKNWTPSTKSGPSFESMAKNFSELNLNVET